MTVLNIEKIISAATNVINHFPCDKPYLLSRIKELRTVNNNTVFELKAHGSNGRELIIQGLETGLDIEKYFPLRDDVTDDYKNIHSCSVFFDGQSNIEKIIFTLKSNSRSVSFEVEFGNDFEFKWYEMYYFNPEKFFGTCNDSVMGLKDDMSYLTC